MRHDYSSGQPPRGELERMPLLPVKLFYGGQQLEVVGLVDSGAMLNVIPNRVGLELGLVWEEIQREVLLGGTYGEIIAKVIVVEGQVGEFPPVNLIFAWSSNDNIRVILGQYNFFQEFDVHFYRSKFEFEINPKLN